MLIIENGYNTSYIFSLLIGLFYNHNCISELLIIDPIDNKYIYIQEFIKYKIIETLHNNISITSATLNEFRNYINLCEWSKPSEMLCNKNIVDFYLFLCKGISDYKIKIDRLLIDDNIIESLSYNYIDINLKQNDSLNIIFMNWINDNLCNNSKYKLKDIPPILPFVINRKHKEKLDITHKLLFYNINDSYQKHIYWNINSIICNDGESYYVVVQKKDKTWVMFTDKKIPSDINIQLNDPIIKNKIMTECVMIIYSI